MWYLWHLTFWESSSLVNELTILGVLIGASLGIGLAVEHTKSILIAACFHMIGNIIMFSSLIMENITFHNRLIIAGICIVFWITLLVFWDKRKRIE